MHNRIMVVLSAVVLMLIAMHPIATAQDATPAPEGFEIAPGVTAELLPASGDPPSLYRLHFAPDVTYPFADDPSLGVVYVEAGTLTLQLSVPVTVAQVGATDVAGDSIAVGTEFTVTAGDYFVLPPLASGEVRNDGPEVATVSVAGIIPDGMATPTAGTPAA